MELTERLVPNRYMRDQLSKYGYQLSNLNKTTMRYGTPIRLCFPIVKSCRN